MNPSFVLRFSSVFISINVLFSLTFISAAYSLENLSLSPGTSSISVTGECSQYVDPDRVSITATVENESLNFNDAYTKTVNTYEQFVAEVKKQDFSDLELSTKNAIVRKEFDWANGKQVFRGYLAQMGLTVTTSDTKKINQVFTLVHALKITQTSGLNFFVSKELYQKHYDSCLAKAVSHAKEKVKKMAESLDRSLGKIVIVNEARLTSGSHNPSPVFELQGASTMLKHADVAAPTIESSKNEIHVQVNYQQSLD